MLPNTYETAKLHIEDIQREAEHQHLVRLMIRTGQRRGLHSRMLTQVGGMLIRWGQRLQAPANPAEAGWHYQG